MNTPVPQVEDVHLVVFMTAGMSLAAWNELGMFEREVELYRRLRPRLREITLVTYGGAADRRLAGRLPGIRVTCNRWRLPGFLYRWLVTAVRPRLWGGPVVVRSNQVRGADAALRAARTAGGASVARCGYMLSEFTVRAEGAGAISPQADRALEERVFNGATRCVVTTEAMAETVTGYGVRRERIHVIPNYVDTDRFAPGPRRPPTRRVGFIGRLHEQKNLLVLVDAMAGLDAELRLAGAGPQREALAHHARKRGVTIRFEGSLPHLELPGFLASCDVFALPSLYEGHPKALLEAMACGLAVLGTDVPGIREVLRHGETGWLCGTGSAEISAGLRTLLDDAALRERLGRNARADVVGCCSLERTVERELDVISLAAGERG